MTTEPNEQDKALAERIYGIADGAAAVNCVGCIAEMIAEYRRFVDLAARIDCAKKVLAQLSQLDHDMRVAFTQVRLAMELASEEPPQ